MAELKKKGPGLRELSSEQLRTSVDTQQLFEAWAEALERAQTFRGGMHWKSAAGKHYLFRTRDRRGYGKSLGPRSPETERTLEHFQRNKATAKEREVGLRRRLAGTQPERDPLKKPKDREQALLVAELVTRYLPQLRFAKPELPPGFEPLDE